MHGGVIYIRGKVDKLQVAGQVDISEPGVEDRKLLDKFVGEFIESFPDLGLNKEEILKGDFIKLAPKSKRPYAKMYA
jgi:glutamate synthase domain-containing protein 3